MTPRTVREARGFRGVSHQGEPRSKTARRVSFRDFLRSAREPRFFAPPPPLEHFSTRVDADAASRGADPSTPPGSSVASVARILTQVRVRPPPPSRALGPTSNPPSPTVRATADAPRSDARLEDRVVTRLNSEHASSASDRRKVGLIVPWKYSERDPRPRSSRRRRPNPARPSSVPSDDQTIR